MPKPRGGQKQRPLRSGATFAVMAAAVLAATPASAQTLTEAFAYTYNNNPQILAQRALLRSTDEQVPQALANWRPTVTLTGTAGFERAGVAARGTSTQFSSFEPRAADLSKPYPGLTLEATERSRVAAREYNRARLKKWREENERIMRIHPPEADYPEAGHSDKMPPVTSDSPEDELPPEKRPLP